MAPFDIGISGNLIHRLIDSSLNEVYLFDGETLRFLYVNDGARRNLGYSAEDLLWMTPIDIKPEYSLLEFEALIKPLRTGKTEQLVFETKHKRKDGTLYDVEVHLHHTVDKGRSYFFAIVIDITERNRKDEELRYALREAEVANKSRDEFLASMSHDLRTPLNSIIGFTEIMARAVYGEVGNARYSDYVKNILVSAHHLLSLVDNILQISKLEASGYPIANEDFDPVAHSRQAIGTFSWATSDTGKTIELVEDATAPRLIKADPRVARQILNNLLANALRHIDDTGSIWVRWYSDDPGLVKMRIEDDGTGIPEQVIEGFGRPFVTSSAFKTKSDHQGVGLGLYICKRFVEARGGTLTIGNRAEGGAFVEACWSAESINARFN